MKTDEPVTLSIPTPSVQELQHRLVATRTVLDAREAELLELKGECSSKSCRLHYAHSGPCDTKSKCSHCGWSRSRCRAKDTPFLSCCNECARNDGDTHG